MAEDKVELEVVPEVSAAALKAMKELFAKAMAGGAAEVHRAKLPGLEDPAPKPESYRGTAVSTASTAVAGLFADVFDKQGQVAYTVMDKLDGLFFEAVEGIAPAVEVVDEAVGQIIEAFGKVAAPVVGTVKGIIEGVSRSKPGQVAGAAGGAIAGAAGAAGGMAMGLAGGAVGAVGGGLTLIMDVIGKMMDKVALANPALIEQIGIAFDEIGAVIGNVLTPVLQAVLPMLQAFGDFIASILPSQESMNNLMQAFQPILDRWREMLQQIAPGISELVEKSLTNLADIIEKLLPVLEFFYDSVESLWEVVQPVISFVMDLVVALMDHLIPAIEWVIEKIKDAKELVTFDWFGEDEEAKDRIKGFQRSSRGAAASTASFVSAEEIGRKMAAAAFGKPMGGSPEERSAKATEDMSRDVKQILAWIGREAGEALGFTGNET